MVLLLLGAWLHSQLEGAVYRPSEEPEFLSCDRVHNLKGGGSHEPNEVTRLVESTRWLIKEGIKANLLKPIRLVMVFICIGCKLG